jgi:hypothetical protein
VVVLHFNILKVKHFLVLQPLITSSIERARFLASSFYFIKNWYRRKMWLLKPVLVTMALS